MSRIPQEAMGMRMGLWMAGAAGLLLGVRRARRPFSFRDKVVLITGASRGLGLVLARQLLAQGARLAICARDAAELERARAELTSRGGDVLAVTCDVTDPEQASSFVAQALARPTRLGDDAARRNREIPWVPPR